MSLKEKDVEDLCIHLRANKGPKPWMRQDVLYLVIETFPVTSPTEGLSASMERYCLAIYSDDWTSSGQVVGTRAGVSIAVIFATVFPLTGWEVGLPVKPSTTNLVISDQTS